MSILLSEYLLPEMIVTSPEFIIEDIAVRSLNGKFQKTFTSSAPNLATIFKWDFGDGQTLVTNDRTTLHEYDKKGTYTVKHQACYFDAPCCYKNDIPWCTKNITVGPTPPSSGAAIIPMFAVGGFLLFAGKGNCQDYTNRKDCEEASLYYKGSKQFCKLGTVKGVTRTPCCDWIINKKNKGFCITRRKID